MRKSLLAVLLLLWVLTFSAPAQEQKRVGFEECTTGVAAGKATADGRPLLWKNRDTENLNNEVLYFADGKYKYLAVVDAGRVRAAWMGVNEKGFCIENSVIRDMPKAALGGLGNGGFMKLALQTCATVDDFEELLEKTNKTGRSTSANFGVIDAQGGAAIFETGHAVYVKYDANDPETAPAGYIVRANFTMTGSGNRELAESGDLTRINSGIRFLRGDNLWQEAVEQNTLDHEIILREFSRDMADDKGIAYAIPNGKQPTKTTLNRHATSSVGVFHGVKDGEDPLLTTMWVILGEPIFSVAVPCWVQADATAQELDGELYSPLCSLALEVKYSQYDDNKLLNTAILPQYWQATHFNEDQIFLSTANMLNQWRSIAPSSPSSQEIFFFHKKMAQKAYDTVALAADIIDISDKSLLPIIFPLP